MLEPVTLEDAVKLRSSTSISTELEKNVGKGYI